jgi:trehalose 6-phosphate phosphatase
MTSLPLPPEPRPDWAWFLDVDGTLIEIASTPSAIHVPVDLPGILRALADRHDGALALVSGRSVENIERLVYPFRFPAAGLHGMERTTANGLVVRPEPLPALDAIRTRFRAAEGGGVLVEDKGLSLALHYRQAPQREGDCRKLAEAAVAEHPEFRLLAGKMVFEVKPKGYDKGAAMRAFMGEAPFAGRVPVFVGDDVTDEYGFEAANALGGITVLVGPERPTAARYRLDSVDACREWLCRAAGR